MTTLPRVVEISHLMADPHIMVLIIGKAGIHLFVILSIYYSLSFFAVMLNSWMWSRQVNQLTQ